MPEDYMNDYKNDYGTGSKNNDKTTGELKTL